MLSPVADGGNLESFMEEICESSDHDAKDPAQTKAMARIFVQAFGCLADGLAYLRHRQIRHKDIKPRNILIHQGRVLYTDFGLSLDYSLRDNSVSSGPAAMTRRYAAPEVIESRPRDSSSDIFSLGCVFVEMFNAFTRVLQYDEADIFYHTISTIHSQMHSCDFLASEVWARYLMSEFPFVLSVLPEVIMGMTASDPKARWTALRASQRILEYPDMGCRQCQSNPASATNDNGALMLAPD